MTHEEFEGLPQSVKDSMLWAKQQQELAERKGSCRPSEIGDLMAPPRWSRRDSEMDYRRGFLYGFGYAVTLIESLKSKGFNRVQEVLNILANFHYDVLLKWRARAGNEVRLGNSKLLREHPRLEQESWWDLRKTIFERDGEKCKQCSSTENLEAHHQQPVSEGGLPTEDNLITLCKTCHRR